MRALLQEVYKSFSTDEELLRLLYYKPESMSDNPLSPTKDDVLDMNEKWDIIEDRIRFSPTADGLLDDDPICRILFYQSPRNALKGNYASSIQSFNIDVFVHREFNDVDMRLAWITDHIGTKMSNYYFQNIGTVRFVYGDNLGAPEGYFGYTTTFEYGDFQW